MDQADRQIVKYEFANVDADFFPAGWLMQLEDVTAKKGVGSIEKLLHDGDTWIVS